MSKRKGVTPTFRELLNDLKPMTFWQKLDHLWSYYKEHLLIVLILAIVIAAAVTGFINANKDYKFKGMMVNITMSQEGYRYMTDDFLAKIGTGDKNETVMMDYTNFTDLADPTSTEDNYNASLLLIARVSGQMLDCALVDQLALEFYLTQDVYGDLSTFFTQEQLDTMGYEVIYAKAEDEWSEDEFEPYPIALEISKMQFFRDMAPNNEKIYFVLAGNQPDLEAVQAFWDHLNAWEKTE